MKKFYYKKEVSQEKTPIVLRLERRHTMDTNQNEMKEQSQVAARATSVDNLDQLTEAPTIPRVKTRAVAKSLSEDVLSKGQSKAPNKIVTESDLSASWLYKAMQASVNSRFKSPRKSPSVQQADDLSPVLLQDPNMKPVPVRSKAERTSACLCQFATMIAISLCTVGFLASIAGVIYLEVFANRNLTSLQSSETKVDLSDVKLDAIEDHYDTTTKRYDTNEKLIRKSSTEATAQHNSNKDQIASISRILDIGNLDVTESNQYINTTKTQIKFQDGETVIYEMKSNDSVENEQNSNNFEEFSKSVQGSSKQPEDQSFKNKHEVNEEKLDEKNEAVLDTQFEKLKESFVTESKEDSGTKLHNSKFHQNQLKDLEKSSSDNELRSDDVPETRIKSSDSINLESGHGLKSEKVFESSVKSGIFDVESKTGPNPETNDVFHGDNKMVLYHSAKESSNLSPIDLHNLSTVKSMHESQPVQREDEISKSEQYTEDYEIKSEHNVNSMVMVVDEPEEISTDSFISNRNGESDISLELSSSSVSPTPVENVGQHGVLPKKPVNIKVSLAEAMKHLQVLDVNNKLPTSRIKSNKPKGDKGRGKQSNVQENKDSLEKLQYLQKVRLMLYKNLQ